METKGQRTAPYIAISGWLKKYYFIELILWIIAIGGIMGRIAFVPYSGAFVILGFFTLSWIYLMKGMAMLGQYKSGESTGILYVGLIVANFGIAIICLGTLFKVQRWPGSFLPFGILVGIIGFILLSFSALTQDSWRVVRVNLIKSLIILIAGAGLSQMSDSELYSHIAFFRNDERYMQLMKDCEMDKGQYKDFFAYSKAKYEELWSKEHNQTKPNDHTGSTTNH